MFLVDQEQAEVLHRGEDAGSGGDDDGGLALANAPPLLGAFGVREGGMEDGDAIAEAGEELAGDGRSQGDFGDQ